MNILQYICNYIYVTNDTRYVTLSTMCQKINMGSEDHWVSVVYLCLPLDVWRQRKTLIRKPPWANLLAGLNFEILYPLPQPQTQAEQSDREGRSIYSFLV